MSSRRDALAALTASGQPYELRETEVHGRRSRVFVHTPDSLRDLYEKAISDAWFYVYDDERLSFAHAWEQASALAQQLVARYGVNPGDRVAISMRNYPEWAVSFMAATSIGAIAVAMNALWSGDELHYGLVDSGAKVFIADGERLERLGPVARWPNTLKGVIAVRADAADAHVAPFAAVLAASGPNPEMPMQHPDLDDDAIILYTSGSTGRPKGVVSSHRNVLSSLLSWELDVAAGTRVNGASGVSSPYQIATLLGVPLFHVTGLHAVLLASFRAQRKVVAMYRWDPARAAELIDREKIATVIAPSAMTGDLVAEAATGRHDLSTLVSVGGGGAARAPEQVRRIDATFPQAVASTAWGMTETNAIGTGISGADYLTRPESSGRVSAVLDLRIVDPLGETVPNGERGEVQIRGASVFRGYWNRPDATAEAFDGPWFRTGDIGILDEDGFLTIVDRVKDLVIRGGENIGCGSVESALLEHPNVIEAGVYGVPDERLGEEVGATVYVTEPIDDDALRTFLAQRLPRFALPRYMTMQTEPLPRTASGKILKREMREAAIAQFLPQPS